MQKFTTTIIFCFIIQMCFSQNKLVSGPMIGYCEHREVLIWLETMSNVKDLEIKYHPIGKSEIMVNIRKNIQSSERYNPVKLVIDNLEPGIEYKYDVFLDGIKQILPFATTFKTKELWEWRKAAPDFSFMFGSCLYINDSIYDRPGKPYGASTSILDTMGNMKSDFIIWGGDNVYLREADYSSDFGIKYRYNYNFKNKNIQKLRATRANYAIWDDHDYGPNDGDKTFELAESSYECFKNYWGNKTFGENNRGIYHKFKWSDCEFFMLDGRTFRSPDNLKDSLEGKPNVNKEFLGSKQMIWLKNCLSASSATFKFIVNGGQILNPIADKECLQHYPAEYTELMNYINDNKISGVLFLTGDRHFTEMQKVSNIASYPMYDFTCSSFTSGIYNISNKKEFINPTRVNGSLLMENNFSIIEVNGEKKNRVITFKTFDAQGKEKWKYEINENNLR